MIYNSSKRVSHYTLTTLTSFSSSLTISDLKDVILISNKILSRINICEVDNCSLEIVFNNKIQAVLFKKLLTSGQALAQTVTPSENCLFLNIYTPAAPSDQPNELYPVMLFIHGGDFNSGTGEHSLH